MASTAGGVGPRTIPTVTRSPVDCFTWNSRRKTTSTPRTPRPDAAKPILRVGRTNPRRVTTRLWIRAPARPPSTHPVFHVKQSRWASIARTATAPGWTGAADQPGSAVWPPRRTPGFAAGKPIVHPAPPSGAPGCSRRPGRDPFGPPGIPARDSVGASPPTPAAAPAAPPGCTPGCTGGDSSPAPGLLRHSGREACWRPPCPTWRRPTQGPSASRESQGLPRHASYPTPSETRSALEVRPCFTWNIPSRCTRVDRVSLYSARRFAAVRGGRQRPNPTNPLGFRPAEPLRGTEWAAPAPQASRRTGSSGGAHTPATPWNNCRAGDPRRTRGDPAAHVRRPSPLPEEAVQEAPPRALSVGRGPGRSGARSAVRAFAVVRRLFGCRPIRQARDRAPRTLGPVVPPPRHFRTSMTRFWRSAWDTPGIRPA